MPKLEWDDEFSYYWNPATDETFRVSTGTTEGLIQEFSGEEWTATTIELADVTVLPQVDSVNTLEVIVAAATDEAAPAASETLPQGAGKRGRIAIVIPEGIPSGDRRSFAQGALESLEPPFPLLWQKVSDEGHKNSVVVGKFTHIERLESGGLGNAEVVFDTHEDAIEAARQVKEKFLNGVSGDVDKFEAELAVGEDGAENIFISKARLVAATLVAKPAFQEARIEMMDDEDPVILASAGPLAPPRDWFQDPQLAGPTRLSVDDDGRVYGHIATWGTSHLGNPSIKPPRSQRGYADFNGKPVRTADGTDVFTGQLTLTGGHADLHLNAKGAMAHYDNTRSAVADVRAGEDEYGIWVAGAMRPDVTDFQVRAFRASDPSGDWRMVDGSLELVAVLSVNVPGFPVARTLVAAGEQLALVAAGAEMYRTDQPNLSSIVASLTERLSVIENERDQARKAALLSKVRKFRG
jgi:hypothetical protein